MSSSTTPTILVIGSQLAAQNGTYQNLVTELNSLGGEVEMQMLDRIIDGATTLPQSFYTQISLLLPSTSITPALITLLESTLVPGGKFEIRNCNELINQEGMNLDLILGELKLVGFVGGELNGDVLTSTKPLSTTTSLSLKRPLSSLSTPLSSALPARTSKAAKASLWAFTTAASSGTTTPTIDESTLLTAEDLMRPTLLKREDCDVKQTRKACKNCSCGLKELLLDEAEQDDLAEAGFGKKKVNGTGVAKDGKRKIKSGVVTSSCGSCYLGDAFRCASCPYLGMPAFEPGQKVTIDSSMDDI